MPLRAGETDDSVHSNTKDGQKKYKRLFEIKKKSVDIKDVTVENDSLHNPLN